MNRVDNNLELELAFNPHYRMEVKASAPLVEETTTVGLLNVVGQEMEKGSLPESRINIIYPHKDPNRFYNYQDDAKLQINELEEFINKLGFVVDINIRHDISEVMSLDRSGFNHMAHHLSGLQLYNFENPIISNGGMLAGEKFIVTDHCVDQGVTFANMINFVEYNGGEVLRATTGRYSGVARDLAEVHLPQQDIVENYIEYNHMEVKFENIGKADIPEEFLEEGKNNKKVPYLAAVFNVSAKLSGVKMSPGECIVAFEGALNRHGNSVFALTDLECQTLAKSAEPPGHNGFLSLVNELNKKEPSPWAKTPPYSPLLKMGI